MIGWNKAALSTVTQELENIGLDLLSVAKANFGVYIDNRLRWDKMGHPHLRDEKEVRNYYASY